MSNEPTSFWHFEHARFARLLDVLEKQVVAFNKGGQPNYRLMLDVVDYLRSYPEKFHHLREDAAFARLVAREPGLKPVVNRLYQEHRVMAAAGENLRAQLDAALDGTRIPREKVEAAAATYLVYYRQHIDAEERGVMPEAARLLTAEDWKEVANAVPAEPDRLFGEDFDVRYRDLRHQILQAGPIQGE